MERHSGSDAVLTASGPERARVMRYATWLRAKHILAHYGLSFAAQNKADPHLIERFAVRGGDRAIFSDFELNHAG